jgi:phosphate/sulfate permease
MLIKLRFRIPEVLFGILLTVAIFATGAVFWSSPNSSTPTQTQSSTQAGERSTGNKQEIVWWQDPVAVFTLGLVFIGLLQAGIFYGQMRLIRKSLGPAEKAADAANLNAQAVIDAERARLFVVIKIENITKGINDASRVPEASDPEDRTAYAIQLKYALKNYGKTPAIIQDMGHRAIIASRLPPDIRGSSELVLDMPEPIIGENEESQALFILDLPRLTAGLARRLVQAETTFWFFGFVIYDDTFGWQRTIEFVWRYDATSGRFRMHSHNETEKKK